MELKTGLLICWVLMMIQEMTCRPTNGPICDFIKRVEHTKSKMEELLKEFLSNIGNNVIPWPEIPELQLKNVSREEKMKKAQCGLDFMQKALRLIHKHQRERHTKPILEKIRKTDTSVLENTKICVAEHIGNCIYIAKPDFQSKDTYKKKQWDRIVLETSVDFLDELVKIQDHASSKPKHA